MKRIIVCLAIVTALVSCTSKHDKDMKNIASLEKEMYTDTVKKLVNREKARQLIEAYVTFGKENEKDAKSAEYYFKAGETASTLQQPLEAIQYYEIVYKNYPDYEKAPVALFLQGFIYENHVKNPQKAKGYYEEFLKKYPTHSLVRDVHFSLDHLGMSDEDLIRMFEEKTKEKE